MLPKISIALGPGGQGDWESRGTGPPPWSSRGKLSLPPLVAGMSPSEVILCSKYSCAILLLIVNAVKITLKTCNLWNVTKMSRPSLSLLSTFYYHSSFRIIACCLEAVSLDIWPLPLLPYQTMCVMPEIWNMPCVSHLRVKLGGYNMKFRE